MNDLKPCPFCGGEARIHNVEIIRSGAGMTERIEVGCTVCDAEIKSVRHEFTTEHITMNGFKMIVGTGVYDNMSAVEQWNRRASDE